MFIGGDIRYGLGRLKVLQDGIFEINGECLKKWGLDLEGKVLCNGEPIKKYLKFTSDYILQKGKLEFVVQYDFSGKIPIVGKNCYLFVPGSEIKKV